MSDEGPGSDAGDEEVVGDDSADGDVCAMRGHAVAAVAMTSSPHSAVSTGTALTSTTGLCLFDWPDTSARRFTIGGGGVDMLTPRSAGTACRWWGTAWVSASVTVKRFPGSPSGVAE